MNLTRWFQDRLGNRRARKARRPRRRFDDRFAARLVIKPLESRLVLSANVETFLSLSGGDLLIEDVVMPDGKADTLTIQSDTTSADSADYKFVIPI